MRVNFTERFPPEAAEARQQWRLVRKIVDDGLAREIVKRLRDERQSDMA